MGKNYRKDRLGEEIRKLIGEMLINGLKDPRLSGFVSISAVEVTADMSYATIYVTVLDTGNEEQLAMKKQAVLEGFFGAKGMIRRQIARDIRLKHTPELIFKIDESMEYGRHMSEIIDKAVGKDKKNNSLEEIANILKEAQNILLFTHVNMDGDTFGSAVALCLALRELGKNSYILIDEEVPKFLDFLRKDVCTYDFDTIKNPDICVCIDCGDADRFKLRKEKFFSARKIGCIDHHVTTKPFADFNYIDGGAAATAEIIYDLIEEMDIPLTKDMAEAIFTGITTDTGNFQHSSTTARTHEIATELYELNVDYNKVSVNLYQRNRIEKLRLQAKILSEMQIFAKGKAAVCYATQKMLDDEGAVMDDTEGLIDILRSVDGVEVAGFIKELPDGGCKVSLRSKSYVNVAEISMRHCGGGHERASGFSLDMSMEDAIVILKDLMEEVFND